MIQPEMKREYVRTVLSMFVITLVCMGGVALAHVLTKDTVEKNEKLFLKRAVLVAAGQAVPEEPAAIEALYAERVRERDSSTTERRQFEIVEAPDAPRPSSLVFIEKGPGLWGQIEAVVGVDLDGNLTGIQFTLQTETPGLGARIDEPWFKDQFKGRRGPLMTVAEGEEAGPQQFQAITGATITTAAVKSIVSRAVENARAALATDSEG